MTANNVHTLANKRSLMIKDFVNRHNPIRKEELKERKKIMEEIARRFGESKKMLKVRMAIARNEILLLKSNLAGKEIHYEPKDIKMIDK